MEGYTLTFPEPWGTCVIGLCGLNIWPCELTPVSACQVAEVEEHLIKTQEELQNVRRSDSIRAASSSSPSPSSSSSDSESDHEHSEENSTHSAELQTQDFSNHHLEEEERLTEAEKNKQLQEKLKVR